MDAASHGLKSRTRVQTSHRAENETVDDSTQEQRQGPTNGQPTILERLQVSLLQASPRRLSFFSTNGLSRRYDEVKDARRKLHSPYALTRLLMLGLVIFTFASMIFSKFGLLHLYGHPPWNDYMVSMTDKELQEQVDSAEIVESIVQVSSKDAFSRAEHDDGEDDASTRETVAVLNKSSVDYDDPCRTVLESGEEDGPAFTFYTNCKNSEPAVSAAQEAVTLFVEDSPPNCSRCPLALLLGSSTSVGRRVLAELLKKGYRVLHVRGRDHVDLRYESARKALRSLRLNVAFIVDDELNSLAQPPYAWSHVRASAERLRKAYKILEEKKVPYFFIGRTVGATLTGPGGAAETEPSELREILDQHSNLVRRWKYGRLVRLPEVVSASAHRPGLIAEMAKQCATRGEVSVLDLEGSERIYPLSDGIVATAIVQLAKQYKEFGPHKPIVILPQATFTVGQLGEELNRVVPGGCKVKFEGQMSTALIDNEENYFAASNRSSFRPVKAPLDALVGSLLDGHARVEAERRTSISASTSASGAVEAEDEDGNSTSTAETPPPYLSIIVPISAEEDESDTDLATFSFALMLHELAPRYALSYELIIVRSGSSRTPSGVRDWPWLSETTHAAVQIITIRNTELHTLHARYDRNKAINIGARRARGEFLLIARPGVTLSETLVREISERKLHPHTLYTAYHTATTQHWSAELHGAAFDCEPVDMSKLEEAIEFDDLAADGDDVSHALPQLANVFVVGRGHFAERWGFPETTATPVHRAFAVGVRNLLCPRSPAQSLRWLSGAVCSLQDVGGQRSEASSQWPVAFSCDDAERQSFGMVRSWGFPQLPLMTLQGRDVFERADNIALPAMSFRHHPLIRSYAGWLWHGDFDDSLITDFLGLRYPMELECGDNYNRWNQLSGLCSRYANARSFNLQAFMAYLPMVDHSYYRWLATLDAAAAAATLRDKEAEIHIADFGSQYAEWSSRFVAAYRRLENTTDTKIHLHLSDVLIPSALREQQLLNPILSGSNVTIEVLDDLVLEEMAELHMLYLNEGASSDDLFTELMEQNADFLQQKVKNLYLTLQRTPTDAVLSLLVDKWHWRLHFVFDSTQYQTHYGPIDFSAGAQLYLTNTVLHPDEGSGDEDVS